MSNIPTPHIRAKEGDFAKTVLMPGDPLRAKYIAEHYLEDAKLVTDVRNMFGYTGTYKGRPISVMGSGMGMPSIGIYSHELFAFYDVDNIIRIGSAGSISEKCNVRDVVIAQGACTNSAWASQFDFGGTFAPIADFDLLSKAVNIAKEQGTRVVVGNVLSSDPFYNAKKDANKAWMDMGVLCIEMESAALYMEAARCKKKALSILTISDSLITGEELDSEQRQNSFHQMMEMALELA
ncbi:MAG: purine-nucleoside phosphorylase [Lachnospiraceae bacterium]|jgi:purine-nucleoside phosphorylase|nr:purine-nucleoside phosphorylase [Lachnospiraceae bacterium]MBR1848768.1 purine-nucleoside phosphorylase [Lachnospiraceae bacterium]MCR5319845.1 purine-nucleoside phosphorylase [Lachnospiraceae bacterium]